MLSYISGGRKSRKKVRNGPILYSRARIGPIIAPDSRTQRRPKIQGSQGRVLRPVGVEGGKAPPLDLSAGFIAV